ncbi:amine oxidase [Magnetococcus marinus MC-1]|uniref:Amine oxidase n=1 Tax=Magnetococcus marinus (strain ATCC BAA-1437 / JCM 17883 / MC-1) TaxID=156889 RepID=A0L4E1_MAGMM|nr:hydroxysqualene dehydroxylase HpnE [Magnetococcus marinus]ABK42834.1 amine oxidase [Magnetococcus marinus MC-1]
MMPFEWEGPLDLVIIGGGLAGLACASEALRQGRRPLLVEAAPRLGGRVASHWDRRWGCVLDNGPHLLVGAYKETLAWLAQLGVQEGLQRGTAYHFYTPQHGHHKLSLGPGWAAWRLGRGLAQLPGLSGGELWSLRGLLPALWREHVRGAAHALTVTQWLQRAGSPPQLFERLWEPLCLATLNEGPGSADAHLFAGVLSRLFLWNSADAQPLYPTQDLSSLLVEPARRWIEQRGGVIRTGLRLQGLEQSQQQITALILHSATEGVTWHLPAGLPVVLAIPHWSLASLLPQWAQQQGWTEWPAAPIVAVHLRYDGAVKQPAPMVGMPGSVSQWLCQWPMAAGEGRISAAISAAYREVSWQSQRLIDAVHQDVVAQQPQLAGMQPQGRVIKTQRATFASWPGVNRWRPNGRCTPWHNMYLAGDWTATGLPATIEGAVQSGRQAAQAIFTPR